MSKSKNTRKLLNCFISLALSFPILLAIAEENDHKANCLSTLTGFSNQITMLGSNEVSPDLADGLAGKLKMNMVPAGEHKLPEQKNPQISEQGIKSCLSLGVDKKALAMLIAAIDGLDADGAYDKYSQCTNALLALTSAIEIYSKDEKLVKTVWADIEQQLQISVLFLSYLYPQLGENGKTASLLDFQRRLQSIVEVPKYKPVEYFISQINSCFNTGIPYQGYVTQVKGVLESAKNHDHE